MIGVLAYVIPPSAGFAVWAGQVVCSRLYFTVL